MGPELRVPQVTVCPHGLFQLEGLFGVLAQLRVCALSTCWALRGWMGGPALGLCREHS